MKDNKKHINQKLTDRYPKPGIPPESAWVDMKGMLDHQMPPSPTRAANWLKTFKLLSVVTLVGGGLIYLILSNTGNHEISRKKAKEVVATVLDADKKRLAPIGHIDVSKGLSGSGSVSKTGIRAPPSDSQGVAIAAPHLNVDPDRPVDPSKSGDNDVSTKRRLENAGTNNRRLPESNLSIDKNTPSRTGKNKKASKVNASAGLATTGSPPLSFAGGSQGTATLNGLATKNQQTLPEEPSSKNPGEVLSTFSAFRYGSVAVDSRNSIQQDKKSEKVKMVSVYMLDARPFVVANNLAQILKGVAIQSKPVINSSGKEVSPGSSIFKDIHAGLLWNVYAPFSGNDAYFKGTNNASDFYKNLIPGIWLGKTLNSGSEVLVKARIYNPYFGKQADFSVLDSLQRYRLPARDSIPGRDSIVTYHHSVSLVKVSGFNVALQYNQRATDRLSIGAGASLQWQKNALVRYSSVVSDSSRTISALSNLVSLTQGSDSPKYLNSYFLATNLEVLYSWKKLQFGAGITMPITSMIVSPFKSARPVSGHVTVRWWLR